MDIEIWAGVPQKLSNQMEPRAQAFSGLKMKLN
jgi:hypothetical protein